MEDYTYPDMENEQLFLIVTSTFGNGDPPENGEVTQYLSIMNIFPLSLFPLLVFAPIAFIFFQHSF